MRYISIFTAITLFILIIASINFVNLPTARASGRDKEVVINKILPSNKGVSLSRSQPNPVF